MPHFAAVGQVRLDEGELGESFEGPPAAPGAALLDLDRPDRALGLVIRPSRGLLVMRVPRSIRAGCG